MGSVRAIRRNIERNSSDKTSGDTRGNVGTKLRGIRRIAGAPAIKGTIASLLASAGIGSIAGSFSMSQPAAAQGSFPGNTTSYYIDNLAALHQAGYADAGATVSGDRNVILDFGTQVPDQTGSTDKWGTQSPYMPRGVVLPDNSNNPQIASVESAVTTFILGWLSCNPNLQGWIGVGTNDSVPSNVNATSGHIWGEMIKGLHGRFASTPINVRGADDIELSYASFSQISDWIGGTSPTYAGAPSGSSSGYQGGAGAIGYFDYGSAGSCSSRCHGGFTWPDVYDVAAGYYDAIAMPENYYPGDASDWLSVENHASYNSYKNTYGSVTIPFSTVMAQEAYNSQGVLQPIEYSALQSWDTFTTTVGQYSLASTVIEPMT